MTDIMENEAKMRGPMTTDPTKASYDLLGQPLKILDIIEHEDEDAEIIFEATPEMVDFLAGYGLKALLKEAVEALECDQQATNDTTEQLRRTKA